MLGYRCSEHYGLGGMAIPKIPAIHDEAFHSQSSIGHVIYFVDEHVQVMITHDDLASSVLKCCQCSHRSILHLAFNCMALASFGKWSGRFSWIIVLASGDLIQAALPLYICETSSRSSQVSFAKPM